MVASIAFIVLAKILISNLTIKAKDMGRLKDKKKVKL